MAEPNVIERDARAQRAERLQRPRKRDAVPGPRVLNDFDRETRWVNTLAVGNDVPRTMESP